MSRGRRRDLSHEERQLWDLVARSASPLRAGPKRAIVAAAEEEASALPAGKPQHSPTARAMPVPTPIREAPKLSPLDRRTRTRLSRGAAEVERRLDLHGLTQSAAHTRLRHFLEEAQAAEARLVLVITGKGKLSDGGVDDRGVLRRMVPEWLQSSPFRALVAGFDEAGRRHGGTGALYIRVRRKRP